VVEEYVRACKDAVARKDESHPDLAYADLTGQWTGAREVLRRLEALPESCPAHPGRDCAPETPGVYECRVEPVTTVPTILDALTMLGRALRANSGGIHTSVTLEVTSGDHFDTVARGLAGHAYSRIGERIHCETGEVPVAIVRAQRHHTTSAPAHPASAWCDGEHDWDGRGADLPSDGRMEVRCSRCPAVARLDSLAYRIPQRPEPEPTAPEVVWEGEGVLVTDMEPVGIVVDNVGRHPLNEVALILGRALAEAKREVAKAAESMRERALAQAHILATAHVNPKVREACASLAREIGALSLEET